jgi:hypothetical protein
MTHREDDRPEEGFGVLRSPGSGTGRPEGEHAAITTSQTSSGLGAGDPQGGPKRTPERQDIDATRGRDAEVKRGSDPDSSGEPPRAPEDVNATPPHGDIFEE